MARLNYKSYPFILHLARNLRNNQTSHEILVWNILRRKKLSGHKFLRQHPIFYSIRNDWVDFYIADFYCAKLKLIIEVDGKIHESQKEYELYFYNSERRAPFPYCLREGLGKGLEGESQLHCYSHPEERCV